MKQRQVTICLNGEEFKNKCFKGKVISPKIASLNEHALLKDGFPSTAHDFKSYDNFSVKDSDIKQISLFGDEVRKILLNNGKIIQRYGEPKIIGKVEWSQ